MRTLLAGLTPGASDDVTHRRACTAVECHDMHAMRMVTRHLLPDGGVRPQRHPLELSDMVRERCKQQFAFPAAPWKMLGTLPSMPG